MTLEDYYEKRKEAQIREASALVREYRAVYGKEPDAEVMSEFFWLFSNDADPDNMPPSWKHQMRQAGNESYSFEKLHLHHPTYPNMKTFLYSDQF